MTKPFTCVLLSVLCSVGVGCSTGSSGGSAGAAAIGSSGSASLATSGRVSTPTSGMGSVATSGRASTPTSGTGSVATSGSGAASGSSSAGKSGSGGLGTTGGSGGGGATGTSLTGTLGALGAAKPTMAGFAVTNQLETLIYLFSAPFTCAEMMTMGTGSWLPKVAKMSQVIEIVVPGVAAANTYSIGGLSRGEVNFVEGGVASPNGRETNASAGSIVFTKASANGVHEGTISVTAPFMLSGSFHAEWCTGGSEY